MKTLFLALALLVILNMQAQQVQNPGFENWTGSFATGWGSASQAIVKIGKANPDLEVQTTTAHSGSYAILLQNQRLLIAGGNPAPGTICTCPIVFSGGPVLGFGPYSATPTSYDFWYQFNAISGDEALTRLYITKWNTNTNKRDTLASASSLITGSVSVYTHMTVPVTWLITNETPDSMQLSFTSSNRAVGSGVADGGMLYIDDVNITAPSSGIETYSSGPSFNMFPNPSNNNLTIQSNKELGTIAIYNTLGELILQTRSKNTQEQMDVSKLAAGVYLVQAQGKFSRLIKE